LHLLHEAGKGDTVAPAWLTPGIRALCPVSYFRTTGIELAVKEERRKNCRDFLKGYHRMSTGEHMRNDDQTGGGGMFFEPGATITATPISDTVGNHSGFAGLFAGLAGALKT
jgi:hypothetical protein